MAVTTTPQVDMGSWISRRAAASPGLPAITFNDETLTYGEFDERIDRLAAELKAGGVEAGARVAYAGFNHPDFLVTLFACSRVGAIFVPINYRLSAPEMCHILLDAGAHTLVADNDCARTVEPVRDETGVQRFISLAQQDGWETLDTLLAGRSPELTPVHPAQDDVAIIMYTSGTTGHPKGAMLTHGNMFWNNVNALLCFDTLQNDISLVCAPMFHIGGLNVTTLVTLQKGGHLVLMPTFDPLQTLQLIEQYRVTTMFGVPAMFLFMSQVPQFESADLSTIRTFICGGAPVPAALINAFGARDIPFVQGYGLTETAPLALVLRKDEVGVKIGAAGHKVLPLSDVQLVDTQGQPVGGGERGEICVRGPQIMAGYWQNPQATNEVIDDDGWFHTGDIGEADDAGYIWVVDRVKDMIISGGENVYPAEVEAAIYEHPAVAEVAILGTPDDEWGEAVTAVVAVRDGENLTLDALQTFARDKLAGYKVPRRLEFIDQLPRNPAGKVLKYQLREKL